jgi:alpha-amylase
MKTINLVLGIHNHQPIGNFDSVFTEACERSYQPFLDLLKQFPRVKLSLHYTGTLLDWLQERRPDVLKKIRKLVTAGQVEMMGGAYYEAILSVIPDEDKRGQLAKLSTAVRKLFGSEPVGMWLAERVWEQHLTKFIADEGLQFIVVDDTHFKYAGFSEEELLGYYMTEEEGRTLRIFPISKMLRYTIPFQPVLKTIDYLKSIATEDGQRIVVYADDGEKFGVWPKTFDHVYTNGWLKEFLQALSDNSDWINIMHFSEAIGRIRPLGRTYLPNASYAEMMHWALPPHHFTLYEEFEKFLKAQGALEKYESFFKGGFWRNFMAKYPEINNMHKKMLRVSARARRAPGTQKGSSGRRAPGTATLEKIWASQCNDPYWHGVFGGLYLPVLRYPVYHNLIEAEKELDRRDRRTDVRAEIVDFDCDGNDEVLVESPVLNCYVKPDQGGSVFELDFKPRSLNVLDIVSRHPEGYHEKLKHASHGPGEGDAVASIHDLAISKERDLDRYLHYDWYRRGSFIDHFFSPDSTLEQVWQSTYRELGDFVNQPFEARVRKTGKGLRLQLERNGALWNGEAHHDVAVRKTLNFHPDSGTVIVEYRLKNRGRMPVPVWFGVEVNVGLQAGDAPDRFYYAEEAKIEDPRLRSMGELKEIRMIGLRDEWLKVDVRLESSVPATFWRFPLETISLSEAGFERIFQSSVLLPNWKFVLEDEWNVQLAFHLRGISS